jgi:AcrR family transcriptional regulator
MYDEKIAQTQGVVKTLSEQKRSSNTREYRMRARAAQVDETRQRIVEAAVRLHGTVGPAATTVVALAEEAGVTRLTVYRHFPDDLELFKACSQHWLEAQALPDIAAWENERDPEQRLRVGLSDLYRFYSDGESMLTNIRRDRDALPAAIRERNDATEVAYRDVLLKPFSARGARRVRLLGVLGHAVSFNTWRSLVVELGRRGRSRRIGGLA